MKETTFGDLDLELLFCTDVLKLNSLHVGYWKTGQDFTLENLRKAQLEYTNTLIGLIPNSVHTILDVGCGIGDVARALAERGYIVTALSPDKNHKKYFNNCEKLGISFRNSKFETFDISETFDLILMSESQNYIDPDIGFKQCRKYLRNGGYLLVSGTFKKDNTKAFDKIRDSEEEFHQKAKKYGLELLQSIDITKEILPTYYLENKLLHEYLMPTLNILRLFIRGSSPIIFKLSRFVFKGKLKKLTKIYNHHMEYANPDLFQKHIKYMRFLFFIK